MRLALAPLLLVLISACGKIGSAPEVDRLEIRQSGWTAIDIDLLRDGHGRFHKSEPLPDGTSGTFVIAPAQFERIRRRLEPYRRQSVPATSRMIKEYLLKGCPPGVPFITDSGAIYIRWMGPHLDQHFIADLGCDAERNAGRNAELLGILRSLPAHLS